MLLPTTLSIRNVPDFIIACASCRENERKKREESRDLAFID
jgi:hypothetical protein